VINRGNYRRDLFGTVGSKRAFEKALWEACAVFGWRMHAHVIMSNHFHLALETPQADLVEGMHWLQGTFATRFNRFRKERGHLFQGRYQAILIEDEAALARVVDYIHLNPVRAGIVTAEQVLDFAWSSLRLFVRGERPDFLVATDFLRQAGLTDSTQGWAAYVRRLQELAGDSAEQERRGFGQLSRGWAIGTDAWRKAIAKDYAQRSLDPGLEQAELRELKQALWMQRLKQHLADAGKTAGKAAAARKTEPWKVSIAVALRNSGVPYGWIADQLHMGSPNALRVHISRAKRESS
jgi:REP element-mobilizing transposase RayT